MPDCNGEMRSVARACFSAACMGRSDLLVPSDVAGHKFHYHCIVPYCKSKKGQDVIVCPIGPWVWEFAAKKEAKAIVARVESEK